MLCVFNLRSYIVCIMYMPYFMSYAYCILGHLAPERNFYYIHIYSINILYLFISSNKNKKSSKLHTYNDLANLDVSAARFLFDQSDDSIIR